MNNSYGSLGDLNLLRKYSLNDLDVWADTESGRMQLQKMSFGQKVCRFFSFCCNAAERKRMQRINEYVRCSYNQTPEGLIKREDLIDFYKWLRKWKFFDLGKLSSMVQQSLSSELQSAVKAKEAAKRVLQSYKKHNNKEKEIEASQRVLNRAEWDLKRAEVLLARDLGIEFTKAGSGANGALFGRGLNGKPLMVIKPKGKDDRIFTERIIGQRTQPTVCNHDPRESGPIAYIADELLGFGGLVPPTYTDPNGWSMQTFIPNTYPADKTRVKGKLLKEILPEELTEQQLEALQLKAVLNFLLGDLDGKDDKLRLQFDREGNLARLWETDNDNILPHEELNQSDDAQTLKKTHQWRKHHWAYKSFMKDGPRLKEVFNKIFDPSVVAQFKMEVNGQYPEFWTEKRWNLVIERIATMRMIYEKGMSPSQLGAFYSPRSNRSREFRKEIDQKKQPFVLAAGA